ncbi:hypothetical protein Back2_17060 [Nocardioides baekrokdamisoli]|uniref:Uncharacterized protein n=1 Tax=Nocardioides baekrokdamisoli TaxID=1804624 RepID=A0A3G9J341_9ACTN|nr:hypothetical protein [Nocardioides baekrokdamisoli]BBH17419.1 hypothetical protein Back2_17060 [Nocardioides baekrokdamisoli]
MSVWMRLSWPLVRLQATEDRITFEARFGIGIFLGPWIVKKEEISAIRMNPSWGDIEIHFREPRRTFLFSSKKYTFGSPVFRPAELLSELHSLGYPVELGH